MSGTGLHKHIDAPRRVEGSAASSRFSRWLQSNAEALDARAAVATVRQGDRVTALASWPQNAVDAALAEVASDAALDRACLRRPTHNTALVAVPIRLAGRPGAIGFHLRVDTHVSDTAIIERVRQIVMRRVEDVDTTAPNIAAVTPDAPDAPGQKDDELHSLLGRQGAALDVIAAIVDHRELEQASRALVDALATRFACTRVSLGTRRLSKVVLAAVSGTSEFDRRSSVMTSIARAMRETCDVGRAVCLPTSQGNTLLPPDHRALMDLVKTPALLSVPLIEGEKTTGALLLERDRPFTAEDIEQITQLVVLSAPVFTLKKREASGPLEQLLWSARRGLAGLFGSDYLVAKSLAAALLALGLWSSQYQQTLSISANASIEASVQRAVVAGANSFINQVEKRAGDVVYQGDVLARLDVEDLQLERLKWASERDKLVKEQRATLAQRDRARVRVLSAQRAQAQAQIDFLDAQIERAVLRAPIDGVVIAGDLAEALGSPVERGQLLFEVASLRDYRLVLTVDESDIGDVAEGYRGGLKLRSLPHDTFDFVVTRITPVSEPGEGVNQFRLEAFLENPPETLRPGMEGVARIDAGEHPIGVNWTRNFVRWARLALWRLGLL